MHLCRNFKLFFLVDKSLSFFSVNSHNVRHFVYITFTAIRANEFRQCLEFFGRCCQATNVKLLEKLFQWLFIQPSLLITFDLLYLVDLRKTRISVYLCQEKNISNFTKFSFVSRYFLFYYYYFKHTRIGKMQHGSTTF